MGIIVSFQNGQLPVNTEIGNILEVYITGNNNKSTVDFNFFVMEFIGTI